MVATFKSRLKSQQRMAHQQETPLPWQKAPDPDGRQHEHDPALAHGGLGVDEPSQPSVIPTVNIIPATPSTTRSNTVRSSASVATRPLGASSSVPEEDDEELYEASNVGDHTQPPVYVDSSNAADHTRTTQVENVPYYAPYRHTQEPTHTSSPYERPSSSSDARFSAREDEYDTQGTSIPSQHPSVHLDSDHDYALALQLQEQEDERPPPLPQRPSSTAREETSPQAGILHPPYEGSDYELARRLQDEEDGTAPPLPIRPNVRRAAEAAPIEPRPFPRSPQTDDQSDWQTAGFGQDDPAHPIHYVRDPNKLTAYLIPFPKPKLADAASHVIAQRFLIYTPPPPPLQEPPEGVKEDRVHKIQRKWQDEVRKAKLSEAKTASWAGVRAKFTRGVSKAMAHTTTSNIDFLSRVAPPPSPGRSRSPSSDRELGQSAGIEDGDPRHDAQETRKTVGIDEMIFVYPPSMNLTPEAMREEFVNTVLRTKSKAMRDSVIATGLLPISLAVDVVLIAVSGLFEVNAAWAYFNIKGAKTARTVAKRLSSSTAAETVDPDKSEQELQDEQKLKLDFRPAERIDVLTRYLHGECHRIDPKYFPTYKTSTTEADCLTAIGWSPHRTGEQKNWEDEAWEFSEVKEDLRVVMRKAAKEWRKYCADFEKDPVKNANK